MKCSYCRYQAHSRSNECKAHKATKNYDSRGGLIGAGLAKKLEHNHNVKLIRIQPKGPNIYLRT